MSHCSVLYKKQLGANPVCARECTKDELERNERYIVAACVQYNFIYYLYSHEDRA